jgi:hypothetical protein
LRTIDERKHRHLQSQSPSSASSESFVETKNERLGRSTPVKVVVFTALDRVKNDTTASRTRDRDLGLG